MSLLSSGSHQEIIILEVFFRSQGKCQTSLMVGKMRETIVSDLWWPKLHHIKEMEK